MGVGDNVLGRDRRPRFFLADVPRQGDGGAAGGRTGPDGGRPSSGDVGGDGFRAPSPRLGLAVRGYFRSLAGMQKEAIVVAGTTSGAWRLVSDEGPYLQGHDEAPFPLAFMTAGMVASYYNEMAACAGQRDIPLGRLRLTLDNFYTMEGSAPRGTMVGGALPPELTVEAQSPAGTAVLYELCADAVEASPVTGLVRAEHTSRFTLAHNGVRLGVGRVAVLDTEPGRDPADSFASLEVAGPVMAEELMRKVAAAEVTHGEGGVGSSLRAEQKRTLHVRGTCDVRPDGLKHIDVQLFKPVGSNFRFLSDESPETGGSGRAPDALTLVAAGIGFCFMTQLGRYAAITNAHLNSYRTVQDTHFSLGGASGGTGRRGEAAAVETHVYLDTSEDDDFARTLVDMGEQTCFLHALCRTALRAKLRVSDGAGAS